MAFNISIDDLLPAPTHCPVLGIKLNYGDGGIHDADRPSLDRVDNSKGYIRGNVCIISLRANKLKNDATVDELERILEYSRSGLGLV